MCITVIHITVYYCITISYCVLQNTVMKLALVGSRNYTNYEEFCDVVDDVLEGWEQTPECIISGGAKGADELAEKYAVERNYPLKVYHANWFIHGNAAGPKRNTQIVKECTHMIAFPTSDSKGTGDSIRKAQSAEKTVYVYMV